jgi:hypothetical protein
MTGPVGDHFGVTSHTGGTTGTISVTASAGTQIVLAIQSDITSSGTAFTNSMSGDTSGVVWQHIGSAGISNEPSTSNTYSLIDVWLGKTVSALSGATVTVTASTTIDAWAIAYRSYTGCAASPLDPNASLPVEAIHETSGGGVDPGVPGLATTNMDDMIVLVCGTAFNSQFSLTPNHGSQIVEGGTAAGTWWAWVSISEYSVSATQSNLTFNCTPAVEGWGAVGFALTADATAASTQRFLMAGLI